MEVEFQRNGMVAAFAMAAAVVPTRTPMPILQNVKMEATADGVFLYATDNSQGIRVRVNNADVIKPGECLLPVARFSSIIRESTDTDIRITVTDATVNVKGKKSKFKFQTTSPSEFPAFRHSLPAKFTEVVAKDFCDITRRTVFARDEASNRYTLQGCMLVFGEKSITAIATNGRTLALDKCQAAQHNGHVTSEGQFTIVAADPLASVNKAFSDSEESVRVSVDTNSILVVGENVTFFSRLVEGRFPRVQDEIERAEKHPHSLTIDAAELSSAIKQASVMTSLESKGIVFSIASNKITMQSVAAEVGESEVEAECQYEGEQLTVQLDGTFLTAYLRTLPSDAKITMKMTGGNVPVLFIGSESHRYVVSPMAAD